MTSAEDRRGKVGWGELSAGQCGVGKVKMDRGGVVDHASIHRWVSGSE